MKKSRPSKKLSASAPLREPNNEDSKPSLVPKLRFPEFRGTEGWDNSLLGNLLMKSPDYGVNAAAVPFSDRLPKYLRITDISDDGTYLSDKKVSVDLEPTDEIYLDEGDIVLARTGASVGKSYRYRKEDGRLVFAGFLIRIKPDPKQLVSEYLSNFLTSEQYWKWVAATSARSGQPGINSVEYSSLSIPLPAKFAEQQKIAECLSSVDELMAAQGRKVDALKTHKNGLMQQLFPREGETQPRLRFPEFQNAGAWEVRTIGEMFDLINGCAFKPEDWKTTGTPIIRIQNLNNPSAELNYSQEPVPERNRVEPGDLLFAWSGTLGSSFGACIWNGQSGVLNQHIFKVLMDEKEIALHFALLVLAKVEDDIARRTHGFKASFVHVKKSDLVKVEMLLPTLPEQHRIASCLSSLDALIAAETQKHAALQRHKRGLMQQLFPSPGESS